MSNSFLNIIKQVDLSLVNPIQAEDPLQLFDYFIEGLDVADSSKFTYRRQVRVFLHWLSQQKTGISTQTIYQFKSDLIARQFSPSTINGLLAIVKQFFNWTFDNGYFPDIAKKVKLLKTGSNFKKDVLTVSQIKDLISAIEPDSLQGARDRALITLMIHTGLRGIEVQRSQIGDLRPYGDKKVLWIRGKGRFAKDDYVVVTDTVSSLIHSYLLKRSNTSDHDPLFEPCGNRGCGKSLTTRSISAVVKFRLQKIGINSNRITAHSLRHSALTFALLSGNSLQECKSFARHANINTTLIYSHNIDRLGNNSPENNIEKMLKIA